MRECPNRKLYLALEVMKHCLFFRCGTRIKDSIQKWYIILIDFSRLSNSQKGAGVWKVLADDVGNPGCDYARR